MKNILISGSLTYDYIMTIPGRLSEHILPEHLDKLNLSLVANTLHKHRGGTAGNIGYTMRLLNTPPLMVGALGSDGAEYIKDLKANKIEAKYIGIDKNSLSPSVYIVTDKDDNQISVYFGGIDVHATPSIFKVETKKKIDLAMVSPSANTLRHMRECTVLGIKTIFDPGQISTMLSGDEFREMLNKAEYYIGNEYETHAMLEKTGWTMKEVLKNIALVITTHGEKGSDLLSNDGRSVHIAPCKVDKVPDPTGGGDAYRAGLLAGMARGYDIKTSAEIGSVAGAYGVEALGGQTHSFTLAEFKARYKKTYHKDLKL